MPGTGFQKVLQRDQNTYERQLKGYVKAATGYTKAVEGYNKEVDAYNSAINRPPDYYTDSVKSGSRYLRTYLVDARTGEILKRADGGPENVTEGLTLRSAGSYRSYYWGPGAVPPKPTAPAEFTAKEPKAPSGITQKQLRAQGGAFGDTPALRSEQRDDANRNAQPVLSDADLARAMNAGIPPATLDAATARNLADIENKAMIQGFDAARLNRS